MSAFAWVSYLVDWFGRFIPRWVILDLTMGGVKFVRGSRVVPLGPGIHWYWPATTMFQTYPTADQTDELRSQTLITVDDKTIDVAGLIRYQVTDIAKLLTEHYDAKTSIADRSLNAVSRVVCRLSWEELKAAQRRGNLNIRLTNAANEQLRSMGVEVLEMTLTDLAPTRVLKLKQSTRNDGEI